SRSCRSSEKRLTRTRTGPLHMSEAGAALAHQYEDVEQQHDAATLAMWIFLVTEVMFFGGLLAGYTMYRAQYPVAFAEGSRLCEVTLGALNTPCSSPAA